MGGFIGHVVPGTIFLLFSVWWFIAEILQKNSRRSESPRAKGKNPHSTWRGPIQPVWYSCPGRRLFRIPVEPIVKVVSAFIGILLELPLGHSATLYQDNGDFVAKNLRNYEHAMMYAFFGLSGVVDLVIWYNFLPLPSKFDYLILSLAFWIEGLLFFFHLHGRDDLNVRLHTILYIIIFVTAAAFLLPVICDQFVPFLGFLKSYLLSLQGTWFIQIAVVLHGPNPWKSDHSTVVFSGIMFSFHALVLFLIHLTGHIICHDVKKRQLNGRPFEGSSGEEANCKPMMEPVTREEAWRHYCDIKSEC